MNPILLKKQDGRQVLIDLNRIVAIDEIGENHTRITVEAGSGALTFSVTDTMAELISAIQG